MADGEETQIPASQADPSTPPPSTPTSPVPPPGGSVAGCKRIRRRPTPAAPRAVRRRPLQSPLGVRVRGRLRFADDEAAEATSSSCSEGSDSESSCAPSSSSSSTSPSSSSSSVSGSSTSSGADSFFVPDSSGNSSAESGDEGDTDSDGSYTPSESTGSSGTREVCEAAAAGTDATALAQLVRLARRLGRGARPA